MNLGDIVGHMDLSVYPQVALVLFLAVFVSVTWRAMRAPAGRMEAHAQLPLHDGPGASEGTGGHGPDGKGSR